MHEDSCIGINYAHRFSKCFRSLHRLLGFSLCTSCRQFNLSLYQFIQFLTCTGIPCKDSHCENGSLQAGYSWIGMLKIGTKLRTLVRDQNFHSVIKFEPELSRCGKGLSSCHVLPACSLVVTCPMTCDVRYSDWVFSIQRIPNFHRVDATNLIEAVTFR